MMVALIAVCLIIAAAPLVAVVLVSGASNREDRAYSLSDPARGPVNAAARRLLDFRTDYQLPRHKNRAGA